jgi:hypothetical protein
MMTGELGNKIDRLWEIFWNGEITNPLDDVEQMSYLLFIKDLDDTDNLRAKEAAMLSKVERRYINICIIRLSYPHCSHFIQACLNVICFQ